MSGLDLSGVRVRYGDHDALDGIDLGVPEGLVVSVLGPSGSGKTTLLRVICGLEPATEGRVSWLGRDLARVPVHERGFGLMFQDYALFPHRNVFDNVAFGLRMAGHPPAAITERVDRALALVGLVGMGSRSVDQLSGGEQQRVALARTLAPGPRLLMLDEPLGSLDRTLRERLPFELREIFRRVGATVLYVTHDQEEAFGVADRTVILHQGRIEADGSPEELWQRPPSVFVARFLGFRNVAPAMVRDGRGTTPWGEVAVAPRTPDGEHTIILRPDAFVPDPAGPIQGMVAARIFAGDHVRVRLDMPGAPSLDVDARWSPLPSPSDAVTLRVEPDGVVVLPAGSGDPDASDAMLPP